MREGEREREKAIPRPKIVLVPLSSPSLETYLGSEWTIPPPIRPPTEYHQRDEPGRTGQTTSDRITSGRTTTVLSVRADSYCVKPLSSVAIVAATSRFFFGLSRRTLLFASSLSFFAYNDAELFRCCRMCGYA